MRRNDNALEVRLAPSDKLVGWLTRVSGKNVAGRKLCVPGRGLGELIVDLTPIRVVIDHEDMKHQARKVAHYAEFEPDTIRDRVLFFWLAARVDLATYEQVFDLEQFEPFDNGPDDEDVLPANVLPPATLTQEALEAKIKEMTLELEQEKLRIQQAAAARKIIEGAQKLKDDIFQVRGIQPLTFKTEETEDGFKFRATWKHGLTLRTNKSIVKLTGVC